MYSHTVFSDLVKQIDRDVFAGIVKTHAADKYGKCFKSWQHLVAMLYCQFSGAKSLRAAEIGYNSHANAHYHLGLDGLKRSTLSQSNNARAPEVFRDMARHLIGRAHALTPELSQVVQLIDASPIIYKGRHNQWTNDTRCARIDGLKLHLSFGLEDKAPCYVNITDAKVNDITDAVSHLPLKAGIVYVFDKGYCDYNWWHGIARMGSVFVTRLKANAACKAVESHAIDPQHAGFILKDQTILLTNKSPRGGKKTCWRQKASACAASRWPAPTANRLSSLSATTSTARHPSLPTSIRPAGRSSFSLNGSKAISRSRPSLARPRTASPSRSTAPLSLIFSCGYGKSLPNAPPIPSPTSESSSRPSFLTVSKQKNTSENEETLTQINPN